MSDERHKILTAALDEFSEAGVAKASLESVAARANLQAGAVRALFVDKEALLRELLEEETEPMVNAVALAVEQIAEPRAFLRKTLQLYDQWLLDHPKVVRLFARCMVSDGDALQSLFQTSLMPSELFERLEQMVVRRELRIPDVLTVIVMIDSLILLPHMMRATLGSIAPELTTEQLFENRLNAVFDVFENGLFVD